MTEKEQKKANRTQQLFEVPNPIHDTQRVGRQPLPTPIAGYGACPQATSWSLESRKKSRADLWAFASLLAVEEGIIRHNQACLGDRTPRGFTQCVQKEGEEGCEIRPSRPFTFKTGRKDCISSHDEKYKADEIDVFPDDHLNGPMLVTYMEDHFGFSGKETVAIMGAHTLGKFHQHLSGFQYTWTVDFQAFNNQYYRALAARDDWFFDTPIGELEGKCTKVGDAWGNKARALWIARKNKVFKNGLPIQWIQQKVACPNCEDKVWNLDGSRHRRQSQLDFDAECCATGNVPENAFCRPDGRVDGGDDMSHTNIFGRNSSAKNLNTWRKNGTQNLKFNRDLDFSQGCEYARFNYGRHESALNADMGLMWGFEVDSVGYPFGCDGLKVFTPGGPSFSNAPCMAMGTSKDDWEREGCRADCPKQTYKYPTDSMTLSQHVELYADNQAQWIEDYLPAMERMISNGYEADGLVECWPR